jgi:hypothetical protein
MVKKSYDTTAQDGGAMKKVAACISSLERGCGKR